MKKYIALILALAMVFTMTLTGCGKKEEEPVKTPETTTEQTAAPAPATQPETPPEPEKPKDAYDDAELKWEDLVGTWYLKTFYYDETADPSDEEDPGFWDAYENNTDARLVFTNTDGIDYYWASKYEVSEDYEDMPHEIVKEPVSEDYDFMTWCVTASAPEDIAYRIGFVDKDTIVCYETYSADYLEEPIVYKGIYTKEGPVEFHKSILDPDYILGYWYMNSYEVDGDSGYCVDTGEDCWIYFGEDGYAEFYDGNINWPEEANHADMCEYRVLDEPVMSWLDDSEYPDRQDWSVEVDIPNFYNDEYEYYQFGLIDDYTLRLYHEIIADGGSYHVASVCDFSWFSPFEPDYYAADCVLPDYIQELRENAADNQWMIAICNPSEELRAELDAGNWELSDMSYLYDWKNPTELVLAPVGSDVEIGICTGTATYDSDGYFYDWTDEEYMYMPFVYDGMLWRGIVDMPEDSADATLCLRMGFGSEGLNGGEDYYIRICNFYEEGEDPYLEF